MLDIELEVVIEDLHEMGTLWFNAVIRYYVVLVVVGDLRFLLFSVLTSSLAVASVV